MLEKLTAEGKGVGLKVNEDKNKVMRLEKNYEVQNSIWRIRF